MKTCAHPNCDIEFPDNKHQEYCGKECRVKAAYLRRLAAAKNKPALICEYCETEFHSVDRKKKYCSPECSGIGGAAKRKARSQAKSPCRDFMRRGQDLWASVHAPRDSA